LIEIAPSPRKAGRRPRRGPGRGRQAGPRYPEFDALRATAILLVVTLHSALAYTHHDIPRLLWGVREPSPHTAIDLFCWWAMGVSVPLFFAISGFFAAAVESARGPSAFLAGRVRRVVLPAMASAPVVLPLCFFAWSLGWLATNRCTTTEFRRMRFLDPAIMHELYGPAHLWFLEYLILMLAAFWAVRALDDPGRRRRRTRPGRRLLAWWSPLALAIPSGLLLFVAREASGIDSALDRHNSFLPDPIRLAYYATFFGFGVGAFRDRSRLDALAGRAWWYLAASVPAFVVRAALLPRDWSGPLAEPRAMAMAAAGGLFAWLTLFGLLGLYRRHLARPSPAARYLAGASFWVYLVHLPIVGLIQADLIGVPWPTAAKFALTWALTMTLGLASYHVLARRTALGRFLGGRAGAGRASRPLAAAATIRVDPAMLIRPRRPIPRRRRSGR